jgi:hypothetical protein
MSGSGDTVIAVVVTETVGKEKDEETESDRKGVLVLVVCV